MKRCDCHADYHELGVHRPGLGPADPPPTPLVARPAAMMGAA